MDFICSVNTSVNGIPKELISELYKYCTVLCQLSKCWAIDTWEEMCSELFANVDMAISPMNVSTQTFSLTNPKTFSKGALNS